jgi:hypothetical protein
MNNVVLVLTMASVARIAAGTVVSETHMTRPNTSRLAQGTITITAAQDFTSINGMSVLNTQPVVVAVVDGAFRVELEPTPLGLWYIARWQLTGARPTTDRWFVPNSSTTLSLFDVRSWRGAWSPSTTYATHDKVGYAGTTYIATAPSRAVPPGTEGKQWALLGEKGELRPQGPSNGWSDDGSTIKPMGPRNLAIGATIFVSCGGSDDTRALTAALLSGTTINATGTCVTSSTLRVPAGKLLHFGPGIHLLSGLILPDSSTAAGLGNTTIECASESTSTLKLRDGADRDLIATASFYDLIDSGNQFGAQNPIIRGCTLEGNKNNQSMKTVAVSFASNANPIVITTAVPHGYSTGDVALIKGVLGNLAANGLFRITAIDQTTFSLDRTIGSGAYTSGGIATTDHRNGIVVYGRGPSLSHIVVQNFKGAGIVSGWAIEPSTAYQNVNDKIVGDYSFVRTILNDFDGLLFYGPHDSVAYDVDAFRNGGWGLNCDTRSTFTAGLHAALINTYGNAGGGIYNNCGIQGVSVVGSTITGVGMYVGRSGSGTAVASSSFGGSVPLVLNNAVSTHISGTCANNGSEQPCIQMTGGYGNTLDIDFYSITSGSLLSVSGETGSNTFRGRGALGGTAVLLDPANLPRPDDTVDLRVTTSVDRFPIQHEQGPYFGFNPVLFVELDSVSATIRNGDQAFCSDCKTTSPCSGNGTGAIAVRLHGAWQCDGGLLAVANAWAATQTFSSGLVGDFVAVDTGRDAYYDFRKRGALKWTIYYNSESGSLLFVDRANAQNRLVLLPDGRVQIPALACPADQSAPVSVNSAGALIRGTCR